MSTETVSQETTQAHRTTDESYCRRLAVHLWNRTPSWKTFGEGCAHIEFDLGKVKPHLAIHASETAHGVDYHDGRGRGRDVTKEVLMTLDEPAARALYVLLHEAFGA